MLQCRSRDTEQYVNTTVRSVYESACFYLFMQTSSMVNYIVHYRHITHCLWSYGM